MRFGNGSSRAALAVAAALTAWGCNEPVSPGPQAPELAPPSPAVLDPALTQVAAPAVDAAEELAAAVGAALGDPGLRLLVFAWFRASPNPERKIPFKQFLAGPGRPLAEAIARLRGVATDQLLAELASLPELQFYLPVPTDRTTWDGQGEVWGMHS